MRRSSMGAALEAASVEFIDENGGVPGVRLRKGHRKKPNRKCSEAENDLIEGTMT
jgi:hypothetical protein